VKKINLLILSIFGIFLLGNIFASIVTQELKVNIIPGNLEVFSPVQNVTYNNRMINLKLEMSSEVESFEYGELNERKITLCRNCKDYNNRKPFGDGFYELDIVANFPSGEVHKYINFSVDSREPRIRSTEPRKGFANGNFLVEFDEVNPTEVKLYYGNDESGIRTKNLDLGECYSDRYIVCETNVNLDDFDGEEIKYWFEVKDLAENYDKSREVGLSVDISFPVIENIDYEIEGRRAYFKIKINESNFKEVSYKDLNDERSREKILCRRLNKDVCEGRISLRDGEHNLSLIIRDEANNFVEKNILMFIDSKNPRIYRTEPRRGFANGEFSVEFNEENPKELFLNYGNEATGFRNEEVDLENCEENRFKTICVINVNLSDYHGEKINYNFNLSDKVGNYEESREVELSVDILPPILNNLNSFFEQGKGRYGKYVYFNLNITEDNLAEVSYKDLNDERSREKILCRRLNKDVCEGRERFRNGEYNLSLIIRDEAENVKIVEGINFKV
jgi:hypothetical protein